MRVGVQTAMRPGAQGRRDNNYQGGSNWTDNEHREATCSNRGALGTMPADTSIPRALVVQAPSDLVLLPVLLLPLLHLFGMNIERSMGAAVR
ncbi:hypothetical protein FIBSPDRAFT_861044 [Athelia psychrophila]|uniref:Uncharacterized protein n=1 Tax=Athelia psychrophila TaxID=1759441 RepID=A0A166JIU9_9AGAM|nr:hypothetical protein FIBSPDRAFT_861044 [Fibularhizoctonia sp. CBS 109695]